MSTNLQAELDAILHHAAIASLDDRAFLRVTGSDATRWLNGMVTNSVQALQPGEGCYAFLLNAQGRILGDLIVYRELGEPAYFLIETAASQVETLRQHLDHFIIMDDVELIPAFTDETTLLVLGPEAAARLNAIGVPAPDALRLKHADTPHGPILLTSPHANTFELRGNAATISALRNNLTAHDTRDASPAALEALRILQARPLYGRDITEKYLPQETNQPHALHFNKGCYLGQEIVERIRSRGQVHRLLTPLTLTGELPSELPSSLTADGKPVGEITSAALVPIADGNQILALGYVRREALEGPQATHGTLTYPGGTARARTPLKVEPPLTASK